MVISGTLYLTWRCKGTISDQPHASLPPSGSCHQCPTRTTPYSSGIWTSFKWYGRWVLKSMLNISSVVFEARGVKYTALAVTLTSIRLQHMSYSHQSQQDLNQHQPVWEAGVLKRTLTTAASNISLIFFLRNDCDPYFHFQTSTCLFFYCGSLNLCGFCAVLNEWMFFSW